MFEIKGKMSRDVGFLFLVVVALLHQGCGSIGTKDQPGGLAMNQSATPGWNTADSSPLPGTIGPWVIPQK